MRCNFYLSALPLRPPEEKFSGFLRGNLEVGCDKVDSMLDHHGHKGIKGLGLSVFFESLRSRGQRGGALSTKVWRIKQRRIGRTVCIHLFTALRTYQRAAFCHASILPTATSIDRPVVSIRAARVSDDQDHKVMSTSRVVTHIRKSLS